MDSSQPPSLTETRQLGGRASTLSSPFTHYQSRYFVHNTPRKKCIRKLEGTSRVMKVKSVICAAAAIIVAIAGIWATPHLINHGHHDWAIYSGALTGFIGLTLLLELKISRFAKGMCLVGFGVLFQILYTEYYFIFIERGTTLHENLKLELSLYTQLISLACAGAGGSIVAAYADTNTTDYHVQSATQNPADNTQKINELIASTNNLNKKINLILTCLSLTLAAALIILMFWVLK